MANKTLTFDIFGRDRTASKAIKGVGTSVGGLNKKFGMLAGGITAAFSVREIVNFGKSAVNAFLDAEKAQFKLQDAFDRFPAIADTNVKEIQELAKATMLKTGYDDDAIATGVATLAQYKLNGAQLKQLTPLLVDYARKTGKDLPSAAQDLGKALLGQGRALKDVGIQFKDTGSVAGNFDQLVTSLGEKVGGVAEKFGTTDAGKLEIMKARFEEIQESIGAALFPLLEQVAPSIEQNLIPAIENIIPSLGPVVQAIADFAADWLTGFGIIQQAAFKYGQDINNLLLNLPTLAYVAWNGFSDAASDAINGVLSALFSLVGPINDVLAGIGKITGTTVQLSTPKIMVKLPKVRRTPGASGSGGAVRTWAAGGILPATPGGVSGSMGRSSGTFAEVGVDEAVIPLTKQNLAAIGGGGSGLTVNVTVTGIIAGTEATLGKAVVGAIRTAVKSGQIPAGYALA